MKSLRESILDIDNNIKTTNKKIELANNHIENMQLIFKLSKEWFEKQYHIKWNEQSAYYWKGHDVPYISGSQKSNVGYYEHNAYKANKLISDEVDRIQKSFKTMLDKELKKQGHDVPYDISYKFTSLYRFTESDMHKGFEMSYTYKDPIQSINQMVDVKFDDSSQGKRLYVRLDDPGNAK